MEGVRESGWLEGQHRYSKRYPQLMEEARESGWLKGQHRYSKRHPCGRGYSWLAIVYSRVMRVSFLIPATYEGDSVGGRLKGRHRYSKRYPCGQGCPWIVFAYPGCVGIKKDTHNLWKELERVDG